MRKAMLVARDFAGSFGLCELAGELGRRGMECLTFLGMGRPLGATPCEIRAVAARSDYVVVGRSSSPELAEPEMVALESAFSAGVPAYMYSDGWISMLPWFAEYYAGLEYLFVLHQYCSDQVQRALPGIAPVVCGNPEWETFFPGPGYEAERQNITRKLCSMGAPAGAEFILVPGNKHRELNLELWADVAYAAEQLPGDFCLVASMHPGDACGPADYQDAFGKLGLPKLFLHKEHGISTAELVPAMTWVVGSLSHLGDRAGCQGKRVIDYVTPGAMARLEEMNALLPQEERRIWPPCQAGASRLVTGGVEDLKEVMEFLKTKEGIREQRRNQERFYARGGFEPRTAVKIMADHILR